MELFPAKMRKFWNKWEIRVLVLTSLSIQIFLILFGSRRKRTVRKWIMLLLWLGYLLADWAATLALGVLSNNQGDDCDNDSEHHPPNPNHPPNPKDDLQAFWSPFLLLHLGGPDTITAFSLEDNELWLRHLLGLLFQVVVAVYIFLRSLPSRHCPVTVLMFIAGIIKYGERTWALRIASRDNFRDSMLTDPDPGPNYAKFMEEYSAKISAGFNADIICENEPESQLPSTQTNDGHENGTQEKPEEEMELLSKAHHFFHIFKRLIVDLILTFHHRNESQSYFMKRTWKDAYKVIEIELGFVYEVLYTKAAVIHTHAGSILRFFSVSSIIISFVIFLFTEKHQYIKIDIYITYVLLGGAICLEIWSLTRLVFSDWTIIWMKKHNLEAASKLTFKIVSYFRPPEKLRWSNSMAQYNLIYFCFVDQPSIAKKIMQLIKIKDIFDKYWYRTYINVTNDLKESIFKDLKEKLPTAIDSGSYKHFSTCRGELALQTINHDDELERSIQVEFDESILLWHIATDICYYEGNPDLPVQEHLDRSGYSYLSGCSCPSRCFGKGHEQRVEQQNTDENPDESKVRANMEKSRAVSNYMLYILVSRPFMLTAGIGQIRFGDTCAEAKNFFYRKGIKSDPTQACEKLKKVETKVPPIDVKGDRSKSVLFDACRLAKSLLELDREKRWEIISLVWLEMLYYAASHCRGNYHAQRLSAGGEFLTIVWFLMAHLGIGEQYRVESGHGRAKLIVEI